jgi:hypothetical protein
MVLERVWLDWLDSQGSLFSFSFSHEKFKRQFGSD